ncbi:hypothetical protein [Dactylosporangium sp. NPDC051541]|uniref:hypothetical protein n=1 Tax=Dactylosporangium sp. NPDC051541 TaxID=3363977 RepID=UPI0037A94460
MDLEDRLVRATVLALRALFELNASQIDPDLRLNALEGVEFEIGQMNDNEIRQFQHGLEAVRADGSDVVESLRLLSEQVAGPPFGSTEYVHGDVSDRLVSVLLAPCRVLLDLEPPLIDGLAQARAASLLLDELDQLPVAGRAAVLAALDRLEASEPADAPFLSRLRDRLGWATPLS